MHVLLLALTLTATHRYTAQDAQALFDAGNEAYFRGDYDTAVAKYAEVEADGWQSADVEYNLGTALMADGKLGRAILALERARRIAPQNEDVVANLERARHELVDKVSGQAEEPLATRVADVTTVGTAGLAFLGAWLLLWLGIFGRRVAALRSAAVAAIVLGAAGALSTAALLGVQWFQRERMHEAVIVGTTVPAREGPSPSAKALFELHEGTEVRVIDREGDFARVRLRNGLEGWAKADGVEEI